MRVIEPGRERFRSRLTKSIEEHDFSQGEVARRVGVKRAAVSAWCKGRNTPSLETTRKLAAIFQWPIAEVLGWFGVYEPPPSEVDDARQKGETSPGGSAKMPAPAVTTPVTLPAQPSDEYPRKELLDVPTSNHRALYAIIATLTLDELGPVARVASEAYLRHFGGAREATMEGDRRAQNGSS
jgi:DNA-binding XRE family transcriptional regulator